MIRRRLLPGSILDALWAASWLTMPFWLAAFSGIGSPLDPQYLGNMYHNVLKFSHVDYLAALLLTTLLAGAFWLGVYRKGDNKRGYTLGRLIVSIVALGVGANGVRVHFLSWLELSFLQTYPWWVALLGMLLGVSAWRMRRVLVALVSPATRIGTAIFVLAAINTGVAVAKLQPKQLLIYENAVSKPLVPDTRAPTRVIWMIFDELDERVGFIDRPPGVAMPALDRFRRESVVALRALPPGDVTLYSMPTLFLGRRIRSAIHHRQDDLLLHPDTGPVSSWRESRGIFKDVREIGYDSAVVAQGGHAYCRLFAARVSYCAENNDRWAPQSKSAVSAMIGVARTLLEHIPFVYRALRLDDKTRHSNTSVDALLRFQDIVNDVLAQSALDLVFIHWNLPHWPFFYDYNTDRYIDESRFGPDSAQGYLGNLELTDKVFSEARSTLEAAGLWKDSAIVVSSDHRWRNANNLDGVQSETVPLMIKLPGATSIAKIDTPVDTVNSRRLIRGLLTGTITDTASLLAALAEP